MNMFYSVVSLHRPPLVIHGPCDSSPRDVVLSKEALLCPIWREINKVCFQLSRSHKFVSKLCGIMHDLHAAARLQKVHVA